MEIKKLATTKESTKSTEAKAIGKGKQPKAPHGADKKPILRDQFGFGLDTKAHKFGKMLLRDGGCTMKEVREAEWNPKGVPFYNVFKSLAAKGLAEKKDGRLYAKQPASAASHSTT